MKHSKSFDKTLGLKLGLNPGFLILFVIFSLVLPNSARAITKEELEDKIIELSVSTTQLEQALYDILYSLPPFLPETLDEYLQTLFENNGIFLSQDDFLYATSNPYLDFAKILNLIPDSYLGERKVNEHLAQTLQQKFAKVRNEIVLDGLLGKVDMHEHYRTGGNLSAFFEAAGKFGVSRTVFVPTGFGPDNRGYKSYQKWLVKYAQKIFPKKIIAFCTVDEQDPKAADIFEDCLKQGGKGLKLLGGHPNFYDEPLDSENMYRVYRVAEKYKVPVLIHGSIINIPQIKSQLERVYADFPNVTFIHAHYCSAIFKGINLDQCAELLDAYPNLYIDLSMGGGIARYHRYLRQDLNRIKDFVVKYQDRILFGSDIILDDADYKTADWIYSRMKCDIDLHQKEEYVCDFGEKDRMHQGFNLDKEVLRKLYWKNPAKVFGW